MVGVYRTRNSQRVISGVLDADRVGWDVRLWGLDGKAPELGHVTVDEGFGTRFAHINRLAECVPEDHWLVICDDDVEFCLPRGIVTFLKIAALAGFDLAQPAHASRSHVSHAITRQSRRTLARRTTFVEIGPVLALSPSIRTELVPFPEEGMGWGVDIEWTDLTRMGYRLGIVDAAPLRHLEPAAEGYDRKVEDDRVKEMLRQRGVATIAELQRNLQRLRWF